MVVSIRRVNGEPKEDRREKVEHIWEVHGGKSSGEGVRSGEGETPIDPIRGRSGRLRENVGKHT